MVMGVEPMKTVPRLSLSLLPDCSGHCSLPLPSFPSYDKPELTFTSRVPQSPQNPVLASPRAAEVKEKARPGRLPFPSRVET